jgi:acetyl esterase/lipase
MSEPTPGQYPPPFVLSMEPPPPPDVSYIERKWLDLPYATLSAAQQLDIYLPNEGDGPFPVVFYVHGGGFAIGDKRDGMLAPSLVGLERGYAVVSTNYRLSGEAAFPAAVKDVKAALRWIKAHAADLCLDPGRIAAFGGSAGGHLAAMLGVSAGAPLFVEPAFGNTDQSDDVQVVVDWYGPTDFLAMDDQLAESCLWPRDHGFELSPESVYLGATIAEVPDLVAASNPMTYVSGAMAPMLMQHGTADCLVPYQQSVELARVIDERVGRERFELELLDGAGHGDPRFETPENMKKVFDFIDRHLGRAPAR